MKHYKAILSIILAGCLMGCSGVQPNAPEAKAQPDAAGYQIGIESGLNKVFKDFPFQGKISNQADIYLCRGEYEPIQIVILHPASDLKDVQVSATDLTGPAGRISKDNISINLVGYVRTKRPLYDIDYVGLYPDPLEQRQGFDVLRNDIQPLWVTVYAPDDVAAGDYESTLLIKPANAPASRVKLKARIWDFALPKKNSLAVTFFLWDGHLKAFYNLDAVKDKQKIREVFRRYLYFLIERKISPIWITDSFVDVRDDKSYDFTWLDETLEESFKRGALNFNLSGSGGSMQPDNPFLKAFYAHVKEKGWLDKCYLYGKDEASAKEIDNVAQYYAELKRFYPDLKILQTMWLPYVKSSGMKLQGLVDIWVPLTSQMDINISNECRKRGEQVWWYVCCVPDRPWANFFIDSLAIEPRILFWNNFKYNVRGFLYWGVNVWMPNQDGLDRAAKYPYKEWDTWSYVRANNEGEVIGGYNGDGQLIYPGLDGEPWSSIRMECIRDGIEDFEYFAILQDRLDELRAVTDMSGKEDLIKEGESIMRLAMDLAGNPLTYSRDYLKALHVRYLTGAYLDRLSRHLVK